MTVREILNKILDTDIDEILGTTGPEAETDFSDEVTEVEEAEPEKMDYSKTPIIDLYKECRNRGINVKQKQTAEYYIKALEKYDEEQAAVKDDDDWGDEEEEEKAPEKKAPAKTKGRKPGATSTKKAAKKPEPEPEEDDEEDWEC